MGLSAFLVSACNMIKPATNRPVNNAIQAPDSSLLVQTHKKINRGANKDSSHFLLINDAKEALMWRLALVDSAKSSIDIQTFLWANDHSASLLFNRLIQAANRGVRVRILVDDIWLKSNDKNLADLSQHPNFKIRLYNPSYVRNSKGGQMLYFLGNYRTMNRRMHNKTFIADGVFAINGGRNVGDHYFGLDHQYNFRDLDVLSTGPVLDDIKKEFDIFWNSEEAYPAEQLVKNSSLQSIKKSIKELNKSVIKEDGGYLQSYPTTPQEWQTKLAGLKDSMTPGTADFISDHPDKNETHDNGLVDDLSHMLSLAKKEIIIVSPYFIPYQLSFDGLIKLQKQGVVVRILVPSMGANNHTPAHSHYRKYRRQILEAGCHLHEFNFQPSQQQRRLCDVKPVEASWVGFHMKTFIVDREHSFIGSLNLDPRAMKINTEEGLIIHSKALGQQLAADIDEILLPENSWEVTLNKKGRMVWNGKEEKPLRRQPARGSTQRFIDFWARWLPIEKEL